MIYKRAAARLRAQDWVAITIELSIVVVGVFIGTQVANWNEDRLTRRETQRMLVRLKPEIDKLQKEYADDKVKIARELDRLGIQYIEGGWPGYEVGWGLAAEAQGKGYATEGAAASMDWAFDHLGWDEIIHCIEPANAPSIAVAKRLGSTMLRDAVLPAPINVSVQCWGQSREAWRARRR